MSTCAFACSLKFTDAWRASPAEIDTLFVKMAKVFADAGVEGLRFGGNFDEGLLDIEFDQPAPLDGSEIDSLWGVKLVVKALNSGRVSAPGWPGDDVVDSAVASVAVRDVALT
jgi:hypothetical protein